MNSIFWHDYETSGTSPALDRPLQFAGIRTDEALEIIGEPVEFFCKPSREILPHPEACLITGITPQTAEEKGLSEPQFIAEVHRHLAQPGTCGAGYNSIRFDDEVTRYTLYRNFFDPYEREWQGGNSRWDIIDMLRLTRALRPDGIVWPDNDDGYPSFRLEHLTAANNISHQDAHDALADVRATIAMARLVKSRQPKLFDYTYRNRRKQAVAGMLDVSRRKPFLHVSSRLPRENGYTALMVPLCPHPENKNAVLCFNLAFDPEALITADAEGVRERVFTRRDEMSDDIERIPLKAVHLNRCPVVATPKLLDEAAARRLGIDLAQCEKHRQRLKQVDLTAKLHSVFQFDREEKVWDPETALYDGFLSPDDRVLLARVRNSAPEELAALQASFGDKRYRELVFLYRARYFPGTLADVEAGVWQEQRYRLLTEPDTGHLCLDDYFRRIDHLEAELGGEPEKLAVLASLRAWGDRLLSEI